MIDVVLITDISFAGNLSCDQETWDFRSDFLILGGIGQGVIFLYSKRDMHQYLKYHI